MKEDRTFFDAVGGRKFLTGIAGIISITVLAATGTITVQEYLDTLMILTGVVTAGLMAVDVVKAAKGTK